MRHMAHSIKIRTNIIERLLADESILKLSKEFKIARNTLYAWKNKGFKCLEPCSRERILSFDTKKEIVKLKNRDPKITLKRIKEVF